MEEFKYFRGGATLVILLDGLNWFSKRRCSDKRLKKWDEELQLWVSSHQMIQADEEPQPITRFCIFDRRGRATFHSWRSTNQSSLIRQPPSLSLLPRHCCLLQEPIQRSRFTSLDSFVTNVSHEVTGTRLNLNMKDIYRLITKDINVVTTDQYNSFIIFCDKDIPAQLFSDICYTKDSSIFIGNTGCSDNNVPNDLKNITVHLPCVPSNNNSEDNQRETVIRNYFHKGDRKSLLKPCQICNNPGASSERDRNVKMRKSVSFDDDVVVYVFDQNTPIMELHSEPCTSLPSNYSCNLSDVSLEDSGLEWEDDFSALEKTCHFQCTRGTEDYTLSLPTQSWTSLPSPERFSLPQTCLFLTHVTEADLEL